MSNNFQWTQDNNVYGNDNRVIISKKCNGPIEFSVRVRNSCGWSKWQKVIYSITGCESDCSSLSGDDSISGIISTNFHLYPVPSSSILTIEDKNKPLGMLAMADQYEVTLYNKVYRIEKKLTVNSNPVNVPVSDLPRGIYILTLQDNTSYESHHISIE